MGADEADYPRIARNYINQTFKGVSLPLSTQNLVTPESVGIQKYIYSGKSIDTDMQLAKMKVATELDNLLKTSKFVGHSPDGKNHPFAKDGFDYYQTNFIVDGQVFEGIIDIGLNGNKQTFYGMTNIKRVTSDIGRYSNLLLGYNSEFSSQGNSTDTTVPQYGEGVNTYSTQDGTKKFIAPETTVELPGDQLTDDELLAQLRRRGWGNTPNPRLKHFVTGIINKFRGTPAESDLQRLERMFNAAMENARTAEPQQIEKSNFIRPDFYSKFDEWDGIAPNVTFTIGTTSQALQSINIKDQEIKLHSGTVISKMRKHPEMTRDIFRQIPELLENPVIIQFSDAVDPETGKPKYESSITVMGEVYALDGRPILVALDLLPQKKKGAKIKDFSVIKSAYAKNASQFQLSNNSILYIDPNKKRTNNWLSRTGLQLPVGVTNYGSIRRITYSDGKVKIENSSKITPMALALKGAGVIDSYGNSIFSREENSPKKKNFIAPETSSETAVDSRPIDQWSEEEMQAELRRRRGKTDPNPLQVAQLTPEDAVTTPQIAPHGRLNQTGDGASAFADSVQASGIFSDELKQLAVADREVTRYDVITNVQTLEEANTRINEGGRTFVEELSRKSPSAYTTEDLAAALILISRYEKIGDHRTALVLMEKVREAGTAHGQAVQILSLLSRLTPDGMVMYAQLELSRAYEVMVKGKTNKWIERNKDRFELTDEDIEFIRRRTWQAAQLPKGRDKDIRLAEIATRIQSKFPQQHGQAYKAFQRTAMLLNPKTQLRNVLGNATMAGAFIGSDTIGNLIDKKIAKKTGVRTTAGFQSAAVKGLKQGLFESYDDFVRHISTRDVQADRFKIKQSSLDNFNENHTGNAAKLRNGLSRALNALDRFNSFLLDAGDRLFYEMWFINSLNGQMKANGVTEPTSDMIEIATLDALERTWQDKNALTRWLSNVKNGMNVVNVHGYGLGDVVLKFVKTPANLTKAMLEFSPVGLAKAMTIDAKRFLTAVNEGKATPRMQRAFVKNLSNGIVGSILTAIAAGLAAAGLVTGEQDEDDDVAAFKKDVLGYQPYSFKIGNISFSYDWMQPIGAYVAMMANYYQDKENAELTGERLDAFNAILGVFKSGGRALFNQSFMKSIQTLFADDDPITGKNGGLVSANMTYEQWAALQDTKHGTGTIDKLRRMAYNRSADKAQFYAYKSRLGADAPKTFAEFQQIKYNDSKRYADLVGYYIYKGENPESGHNFYEANKAIQELRSAGGIKATGTIVAPPRGNQIKTLNDHAKLRFAERGIAQAWTQGIVDGADFALKQRLGTQHVYYSNGGMVVLNDIGEVGTAGMLDEQGKLLYDEVIKYVRKQ